MRHLREQYLDWPHEVSIETFAKCNAACTFCPYTTLERIGAKMPDEMLDRIIDELKDHPHPFILAPFKVNEPFLDKRLIPFCQKVNRDLPKAVLRLFTNGSALTERHIEEVAGLDRVLHLWVSLNDHRPEHYERLMSLKFERTAANLDRLHDAVEAGLFRHTVMVSKVAVDGVQHPLNAEFRQYVSTRWPRFQPFVVKPDGWLGDIPLGAGEIPKEPCGRWFELQITATGKAALCCMDGKAEFSPGDLNEQSLFAIYNHPALRENRRRMWSRENYHPCSTCSY